MLVGPHIGFHSDRPERQRQCLEPETLGDWCERRLDLIEAEAVIIAVVAQQPDAESRTRERVPMYELVRDSEFLAKFPDFNLVELNERLNDTALVD
jgi:hypothetical protein